MADKKLYLLDAFALIFRAYYALIRTPRVTSYGKNTNAQFGFTNALLDLLGKEHATHMAVVFDTHAPTERHIDFADYKANRQEAPEDLLLAIPDIKKIIAGFNIPCLEKDGYEADDVIGTLALEAGRAGYEVYMVTPDKDYGQLVRENVFIYKPGYQGGKAEILGPTEVCARWNIENVEQVIDVLGLMGDMVDNIPGIPGVGEKTASKLLKEFGSLENILAHAQDIKGALGEKVRNGKESAILSKKLATIITNVPVEFNEESFLIKEKDRNALSEIFQQLEFRALGKRVLGDEFAGAAVGQPQDLFSPKGNNKIANNQPSLFGDEKSENATINNLKTIVDVPHDYKMVQTSESLSDLIQQLQQNTMVSFDTETTGTDANRAELVGLSFSWETGRGFYVPLSENRAEVEQTLEQFRPIFEDEKRKWIGQNIKYDMLMLSWYGITLKGELFDTMVAHYVIDADGKRNMDALSEKYLGYQPVSIETLIGKKGKGQKTMREADKEAVKEYAVEDADVTWQLAEKLSPLVTQGGAQHVFEQVELPLIPVLTKMEKEGILLDVPFLNDYSKQLEQDIWAAEDKVYEWAGMRFNLASPRQLGEVLFDRMKLNDSAKTTKTGQYATGEEVLIKLRGKHDIIEQILTYRELSKLKSTYVDALPQLIHPGTGRLHTSYNQTIAVTGRLSSNNPNLQNIPIKTERGREIRKAFIAKPGHTLVSVDYSQIELRIVAAISGDESMIQAFVDNKDIHTATAAKVYGINESEVDKTMRRNAKAVNFGIVYGQSAFGLAENLGISRTEAKEIIDNYFKEYNGVRAYMDESKTFARENGYVQTLLGRRRYLRDILSANQTVRGFAERNAINSPIQGSAADMIKLAMIRVNNALSTQKLSTKMLLQVHDELVFEVPNDEVEQAVAIIVSEMEQAMPLPLNVPVRAEAGKGKNWLEAH